MVVPAERQSVRGRSAGDRWAAGSQGTASRARSRSSDRGLSHLVDAPAGTSSSATVSPCGPT